MSSKRRIRRKACKGKVRHLTPDAAHAHLRSLRHARGYDGEMSVYTCPFCGGYHIGHTPGRNHRG